MAFSELLERAGGIGRFHVLQTVTILFVIILLPSHMLLENFSAAVPNHRCRAPLLDNSTAQASVPGALGPEALLEVSIPPSPDQRPHRCLRFRHPQWQLLGPNASATNWSEAATEPCMDGWVYDRSTFTSTTVTEWDLVCSSQALKPMAQSIYLAGVLVGYAVWGLLSSRLGRKLILSWCCLQVAVASTGVSFAPNFLVYCGLRFVSAVAVAGISLVSSVLLVEWTTTGRRAVTMAVQGCCYSTGQMTTAGLAFALRDWRSLQMAVSVPYFACFLASWWLPESARWLIITGKPDQGLRELRKVARINGHKEAKKTLTIEVLASSMEEELATAKTQQSVLDLFRVPVLRWRTYSLLVVSFVQFMSYYGLVLDLQSLGRDIFLLQVLFGAVDFVGRFFVPLGLRCFGRRKAIASALFLSGVSILANVLVPEDLQTLRVAFAVLGKGGFAINFTCYSVYLSEVFPTSLRVTANGLLHSVGRAGAVLGPLIRLTGQTLPLLPSLIYGILPITSGFIVLLFLPETQGLPLPDTIQDMENQWKTEAQGREVTSSRSHRSGPAWGHRREVVITESTWL
ncbi:solute carrier family 22 member 11 isoform X5 [Choloepus didactylus]|uniref:solute carrier family 22 member 11 isoform X5 n=1 Tax=Choloepus didactylus TaxID=27675 RepID=UPI0018A07ADD|nr:solute carrier family 22 member 11 isoform X5 [Choloepus didactylus]